MRLTLQMIKANLIKQIRRQQFLFIIVMGVGIAFFFAPPPSAGYESLLLGGARGINSSTFLGVLAAAVSTAALFLPGFYLLRSQVSEDARLKIGPMISSRPIGRLHYIGVKAITNLIVLVVMQFILIAALIVLQFLYGESPGLQPLGYALPFLYLTLPYLTVCAALAILFDVVPILRGVFGNVLIFFVWAIIITLSTENSQMPMLDLMGMTKANSYLVESIAAQYPLVSQENFGIGYQLVAPDRPAVEMPLLTVDSAFLVSRIIWIMIAIGIVLFSALIFDRFRTKTSLAHRSAKPASDKKKPAAIATGIFSYMHLSPVRHSGGPIIFRLLKGELKIMCSGFSWWWYLIILAGIVLSAAMAVNDAYKWCSVMLFFAIPIWSQMGSREHYSFTKQLVQYRCPALSKWWATWAAGVLTTTLLLSGFLFRFSMLGSWDHVAALLTGAIFVPSLAMLLGTLSHSSKPFEGLFTVWFYIGPLQNVPGFDFLGIAQPNTSFYLMLSVLLVTCGSLLMVLRDKHILKIA